MHREDSDARAFSGGGEVFEHAAVNFSHTRGDRMPPSATLRRPELAGRSYEAVSVSLIVHPRNPYVPTSHANFRFFLAAASDEVPTSGAEDIWWFGGGFDLTPVYGFSEGCGSLAPHGKKCVCAFWGGSISESQEGLR